MDRAGKPFASTIEATDGAPIFGVQWHPERPQFDFADSRGPSFPRSSGEARAMFDVASRFVDAARLSSQRFASPQAEERALIYNYQVVGASSYQAYFF